MTLCVLRPAFATTNNTITIDAALADWQSNEALGTSFGQFYFTWDASNFYFAYNRGGTFTADPDVVWIYISTVAPTSTAGTFTSVDWTGTHTLPFRAGYVYLFRPNAEYKTYRNWTGSAWSGDWAGSATTSQNYGSGIVEIKIPRADIGNPSSIRVTMYITNGSNNYVFGTTPRENPNGATGRLMGLSWYYPNCSSTGVFPNLIRYRYPGVVIADVSPNAGAAGNDYVTLYNPNDEALYLSNLQSHHGLPTGLVLRFRTYNGATGTNKTLTVVSTNTISSRGFSLLASGTPPKTADITFAAGLDTSDDGVVIAYSNTTTFGTDTWTLTDLFGWGGQTVALEGSAPANPGTADSFQRKAWSTTASSASMRLDGEDTYAGHFMDTHNNSSDFVTLISSYISNNSSDPREGFLGQCWHIPDNTSDLGGISMRNPLTYIYLNTPTTFYVGNYFQGTGNPGDMSGGTLYYKAKTEPSWSSVSFAYDSTSGNNKYWRALLNNSYTAGTTVQYYISVAYADSHDTTLLYYSGGQSRRCYETYIATNTPSEFIVQADAAPDPITPTLSRADEMGAKIYVTWAAQGGMDGYKIYRSSVSAITNGNRGDASHPLDGTATPSAAESYTTSALLPNTTYWFAVCAYKDAVEGDVGSAVAIRTARISIDGSASDWATSVESPWVNESTTTLASGSGTVPYYEWSWRDKAWEQRTDSAQDDRNFDLRNFRVAADEEYIYFYTKYDNITDKDFYHFAVAIDTGGATGLNWLGDDSNSDTNGGTAMGLGGEYVGALKAAAILAFRYISTAGTDFRIHMYKNGGSGWDTPALTGAGNTACWLTTGDGGWMEAKVRRSDIGAAGIKTLKFSAAVFENLLGLIGDVDSTKYYAPDALDAMSIARISAASTYNDSQWGMNSWDEDISDSDADFWAQAQIDASGLKINQPPSAPSLSLPADGAGVDISTPAFSWSDNGDPDSGDAVTSYMIEISTSANFPTLVQCRVNVAGTSWTVPQGVLDQGQYYWRVKARDRGGAASVSSASRSFIVDTSPPDKITNLSALPGDSSSRINLSWTAPGDDGSVGNITGGKYRVKWSTSAVSDWDSGTWTDYVNKYSLEFSTDATPSHTHGLTITGLTAGASCLPSGATYYFRMWTRDENANNWSDISVGATQYSPGSPVGHAHGDRETFTALTSGGAYGSGTNIVYAKTTACGRLFLIRGASNLFYEYDIPNDLWNSKATLPAAAGTGSAMVWVSTGTEAGQSWLYAIRGGAQDHFYRYNIAEDYWQTMANLPDAVAGGAAMVWTGGADIFVSSPAAGGPFWRYNIPNNRWNNVADGGDPADYGVAFGLGGGLTWDGTYVYGLRGGTLKTFKRYSPSGDAWTDLTGAPENVGAGGSLLYTGGNSIYAIRGGGNTDLWHYDIETSSWVVLPNLPSPVGTNTGNRLAYHSDNGALDHLYIWRGATANDLWCFRRDITAPSAIGDLTASVVDGSCVAIRLEWTAPYGDGTENGLTETSQFWIQYSDMDVGWSRANAQVKVTAGPVAAGAPCVYDISVPHWGVSYYFKIWTGDKVKNWSSSSNSGGPISVTTTKTLSGKITNSETGQPIQGVGVGLSGFRNGRTFTDAGGNYSFTVPVCRQYIVMPSSAALHFTTATASGIDSSYPDRYEFSSFPNDRSDLDFVGHPTYGNLYYSTDTLTTTDIVGTTKKMSIRFTANDTRPYNRVYTYNSTAAGNDSYVFELRGDDGDGYPGILLSSSTANIYKNDGWHYATGAWSLTKGTTYHMVIYSTYTAATNYRIRKSAPLSFNRPTDAEPDFAANVLDYGFDDNPDFWMVRNFTPIYYFHYAAPPYYQEGNPFGVISSGAYYQVKGSTCIGQIFTMEKSSVSAKAFHFWVKRSAVQPEDGLYWFLLGPNDSSNVLSSGLLASPEAVATEFNWHISEQMVECPAPLLKGSTYWIILKSTGSTSGYYEFATLNHGATETYRDAITYRGADSTLVVNYGTTFDPRTSRDAIFRVRHSTVVTGGPKTITDLAAATSQDAEGAVDLDWTYPGICGHVDLPIGSRYYIQHSTHLDAPFNWNVDNAQTVISTGPVLVGEHQFYTKMSLDEGNTYYFTVWYWHSDFNVTSLASNVATSWASLIAPAAVTNLTALPALRGRSIDLAWTAPGDNVMTGDITGGAYRLKYSTYVDGGDSFWNGGDWTDRTYKYEMIWSTDTSPGQDEALNITALSPGTTYYFRLWTRDRFEDNWSNISNGATSWAQVVNLSVYVLDSSTYNFGAVPTQISTVSLNGIIVRNDGNVNASYLLRIATGTVPPANTIWDTSTTIGANRFVLKTMFKNAQPLDGDFGAAAGDDVLTLEDIYATGVNFSDGTHEGRYIEPFLAAPLLSDTTLWFRLSTPLSTSTTEYQTIPVVITSEETYP